MKKRKYGNKIIINKYGKFHSGREFARYLILSDQERLGKISNLRRQVNFLLVEGFRDKWSKKWIREIKYIADFVYIDTDTGSEIVEDTKGYATDIYRAKKKMLYYRYKICILET